MREIPLFPLHSVLFPGMPIQLHIFEDRYLAMIKQCLEQNSPFGVVLIRQGVEALGPLAVPYPIGCTANIVELQHEENGEINLTAVGDERFRIVELDTSLPFLRGKVEILPLEQPYGLALSRGIKKLGPWVDAYLNRISQIDERRDFDLSEMELPDDPMLLLSLAASLLQIPMLEKQELLTIPRACDLLTGVQRLYRRELSVLNSIADVTGTDAERIAWLN